MSEYLRDSEVTLELGEDERPTVEMPEEKLKVLVAKSTPPPALGRDACVVSSPNEDRISSERAFVLSTPWAARH